MELVKYEIIKYNQLIVFSLIDVNTENIKLVLDSLIRKGIVCMNSNGSLSFYLDKENNIIKPLGIGSYSTVFSITGFYNKNGFDIYTPNDYMYKLSSCTDKRVENSINNIFEYLKNELNQIRNNQI